MFVWYINNKTIYITSADYTTHASSINHYIDEIVAHATRLIEQDEIASSRKRIEFENYQLTRSRVLSELEEQWQRMTENGDYLLMKRMPISSTERYVDISIKDNQGYRIIASSYPPQELSTNVESTQQGHLLERYVPVAGHLFYAKDMETEFRRQIDFPIEQSTLKEILDGDMYTGDNELTRIPLPQITKKRKINPDESLDSTFHQYQRDNTALSEIKMKYYINLYIRELLSILYTVDDDPEIYFYNDESESKFFADDNKQVIPSRWLKRVRGKNEWRTADGHVFTLDNGKYKYVSPDNKISKFEKDFFNWSAYDGNRDDFIKIEGEDGSKVTLVKLPAMFRHKNKEYTSFKIEKSTDKNISIIALCEDGTRLELKEDKYDDIRKKPVICRYILPGYNQDEHRSYMTKMIMDDVIGFIKDVFPYPSDVPALDSFEWDEPRFPTYEKMTCFTAVDETISSSDHGMSRLDLNNYDNWYIVNNDTSFPTVLKSLIHILFDTRKTYYTSKNLRKRIIKKFGGFVYTDKVQPDTREQRISAVYLAIEDIAGIIDISDVKDSYKKFVKAVYEIQSDEIKNVQMHILKKQCWMISFIGDLQVIPTRCVTDKYIYKEQSFTLAIGSMMEEIFKHMNTYIRYPELLSRCPDKCIAVWILDNLDAYHAVKNNSSILEAFLQLDCCGEKENLPNHLCTLLYMIINRDSNIKDGGKIFRDKTTLITLNRNIETKIKHILLE